MNATATVAPAGPQYMRALERANQVRRAEKARKVRAPEPTEPLCVSPQDLYTCHARERIGRLLEVWLERQAATPFELLHRPDLVEALEATSAHLGQKPS